MRALRAYRARVLYIYIYVLLCLLLFGASGSGFFGVIEDSNRAMSELSLIARLRTLPSTAGGNRSNPPGPLFLKNNPPYLKRYHSDKRFLTKNTVLSNKLYRKNKDFYT